MKIGEYKNIIRKAQLEGFTQYTPIKEGDYTIVLDKPERGFRENEVVRIDKIVGNFAFAKKMNRSKSGWVNINNLEKIKVVSAISNPKDESDLVAIRITEISTMKEIDPQLFQYFGKRIKEIFTPLMTQKGESGEDVPIINPKVVIGEFLNNMNAEGFVSKWGRDRGVIYVNKSAHFPIDEIISHEFSHILSFYSKELAEKLNNPSIQLGVTDEELDEEGEMRRSEEDIKNMSGQNLDESEVRKMQSEQYYLKPAEVFAHTEQMLYIVNKLKNIEIRHVDLDDTMTQEQKKLAVQSIKSRPIFYYKPQVMRKLVPYMADKYKIKDYTARRIYESLFDNIENFIPNSPKS